MKSKYWALLLAAILVVSLLACIPMFRSERASRAEITRDGEWIATVDLSEDQEFTVSSPDGAYNTVTVKDGAIAVTWADCPDQYCVARGFCNSGTQIVCLPHRLVIRFLDNEAIDGMVG